MEEYSHLDSSQYFSLTQFDKPFDYQNLEKLINSNKEIQVWRIQITKKLASRIILYIKKDNLCTRSTLVSDFDIEKFSMSCTIYTVRFALHLVAGKRGGWFVIENNGREPVIKDEFIRYGPMRKSGARKHRYRRNTSYSERNQVEFLKTKTPTIDTLLKWIFKKYPNDLKNVDFHIIGGVQKSIFE